MTLGLLLAYSGLSALCFSLEDSEHRRRQNAWCDRLLALRVVGWSLIGVSFARCLLLGHGAGVVTWFGFVSVSGVLLAALRPYASRALRVLAVAAAVSAAIATIAGHA